MLTVIMYHYVRDLPATRYPRIKGLLASRFEGQLDYITRHYTVVGLREVVRAMRGLAELPPDACALTFDDGLIDHYTTVFPRLSERGITGAFFPPVHAVRNCRVLDVHKIHFVLAASDDPAGLKREVLSLVRPFRREFDIPSDAALLAELGRPGRYDGPDVAFIKRLLQHGLPEPVRGAIVGELFNRHVQEDERAFAAELYVDLPQLRAMARAGMEIGGHGFSHGWLETLSESEQRFEIDQTLAFLAEVHGRPVADWTMCYPHGSYNETTLRVLGEHGCALGLTTKVDVVRDFDRPLELQRLNTNDIPCSRDAEPCAWTRAMLQEKAGRRFLSVPGLRKAG